MAKLRVLIDTSFIVALINQRDQYHQQAVALADRYDGSHLLVTDGVLLEVGNALARGYRAEAIQVIEELIASEDVQIVHLTADLFAQAFQLYRSRLDKTWGLVDCLSFVVMQTQDVQVVLTFDQHFAQAGFQILA
ncbi:MAG: type II toxin-antitoxin system VapC family toxin [Elainella sp.]